MIQQKSKKKINTRKKNDVRNETGRKEKMIREFLCKNMRSQKGYQKGCAKICTHKNDTGKVLQKYAVTKKMIQENLCKKYVVTKNESEKVMEICGIFQKIQNMRIFQHSQKICAKYVHKSKNMRKICA